MHQYTFIRLTRQDRVATVTLNRPEAMNALNSALMDELGDLFAQLDRDDAIGAIILTGSDRAFAAGADIKEMAQLDAVAGLQQDFPYSASGWSAVGNCRKPVIAAVAGACLGGGCELAMSCDIIIAADTARFGQPEVRLGIMPGAGGTQRLARAIGKSRTMELCLTGEAMSAAEAEHRGLVSRVVPAEDLLTAAGETAHTIANQPLTSALLIKEAVNQAYETPLAGGLLLERRLFQASLGTEDRHEGMTAFAQKRSPRFRHR